VSNRDNRNEQYKPDRGAEKFLLEVNNALAPFVDKGLVPENDKEAALVFICFAPRAGSTLLSQLLARSGKFSYISNFVARFWQAPEIGMYLQDLMGLDGTKPGVNDSLSSSFGVTTHPLDPHEFGFFWRRFIPEAQNDYVEEPYNEIVVRDLAASITRLRKHSDKPLFFKNSIAGYNYKFIKHCLPDAKFIVLTRDRVEIVRSIVKARKAVYGDEAEWLSLKPRSYDEIIAEAASPLEQVERQVDDIEKMLANLRCEFPGDTLTIDYQKVVESPTEVIEQIYSFVTRGLCD
jgi:hypothetical protein